MSSGRRQELASPGGPLGSSGKRRRLIFGLVVAALTVTVIEGLSYSAILVANRLIGEPILSRRAIYAEQATRIRQILDPPHRHMVEVDSVLGWRYRAGFTDSLNQITAQGLRSHRLYAQHRVDGGLRVAAFGDSFVYGNEVGDSDAWAAQIERLDSTIEVLNYGVGGYGDDQALLRYLHDGAQLSPDVVLLGFVSEDLGRLMNVYRRFRSVREIPLVKPRYLVDDRDSLTLLPSPIRRTADWARYLNQPAAVVSFGRHDYWYEPIIYRNPIYDYSATVRLVSNLWIRVKRRYLGADRLSRGGLFSSTSDAFRIQVAVFKLFANVVRERGATPAVLFFPDVESLQRSARAVRPRYQSLLVAARAMGIECLDGAEAFAREPVGGRSAGWFRPAGHYSPAGNLVLARWLVGELRRVRGAAPRRVATAVSR